MSEVRKARIEKALKNYLTFGEAIAYCKRRGVEISKAGFYAASRRQGFVEGSSPPYLFHKGKLDNWIEKAKEKPPKGWAPISKIAGEYKISIHNIYFWISENKLTVKHIGVGQGVVHVKRESVKALIQSGREQVKKNNLEATRNEKK